MKDEEAKQKVLECYREGHSYRKNNYDKKWDKYHAQYRSILEDATTYPYMSRLFIPYSFFSVETIIPRMVSAVFEADPIIAVLPTEQNDIERAKIMEMVINYQLRKMDLLNIFITMAKNATIYGTAIAKIDWERKWRKKKRIKKKILYNLDGSEEEIVDYDEITGKPKLETYDVLIYDAPIIKPISPYDFVIEPSATSIDDAKYCIMVSRPLISELEEKQKAGIYKNVDKVKNVVAKKLLRDNRNIYSNLGISNPDTVTLPSNQRVTLYEYWEDERVIVLAEEDIVLRNEENPYWHCRKPFVEAKVCPDPQFFWGIGLMEMIADLQKELNDVRNQRLDNVKLALNRMFVVERNAKIDIDNLWSEPGLIILTNYIDGIRPIDTPDITSSAYVDAKAIEDDIMNALGTYDYARGKESRDRETATGILSLQEVASIRFKLMTILLVKNFLCKACEMIADLNEQYLTNEVVIRLTNGQFLEPLTVDDVVGRYDYDVTGASIEGLSKYARAEQLLRYRQILASNPQINLTKLDKELLENLGFKNADEYFIKEQPQQQLPEEQLTPQEQGQAGNYGATIEQMLQQTQAPNIPIEEQANIPTGEETEQEATEFNLGG